jgi:hypothetical protein
VGIAGRDQRHQAANVNRVAVLHQESVNRGRKRLAAALPVAVAVDVNLVGLPERVNVDPGTLQEGVNANPEVRLRESASRAVIHQAAKLRTLIRTRKRIQTLAIPMILMIPMPDREL